MNCAHTHITDKKKSVALSSMIASAMMTISKLVVGLLTGSLGILSEAIHSLLDFAATAMTYFAVRISDRPADDGHPYGHGKIESITALAETVLLFVTSIWIIYEAAHRLMTGHSEVEATWWAIGVIVICIGIDVFRARALKRVAIETRSQALDADALHFSSDVWSSSVVLLGLVFVAIGYPVADTLAAIGVSLFICRAAWGMGRRTIETLMDAAPHGMSEQIAGLVSGVRGVSGVKRLRVRAAGSMLFVDADLFVPRSLALGQVEDVRQSVVEAVHGQVSNVEVSVTTYPVVVDNETISERVKLAAANRNVDVHHINVQHLSDRLSISVDLEIDEDATIFYAHKIASLLEEDIRAELGSLTEVETHIEPLQDRGVSGEPVSAQELEEITRILDAATCNTGELGDVHNVRARNTAKGLVIIFHCRARPDRTVAQVHEIIDELERQIRLQSAGIWRIVTHVEPAFQKNGR